jgi:hypothetical protein
MGKSYSSNFRNSVVMRKATILRYTKFSEERIRNVL